MKTVLTIAGYDPSSGAGVTADLMVFAAHGLFGTSCITGLTVQSTLGVRSVYPVDPGVMRETLDWLDQDLRPDGIKIGMISNESNCLEIVRYIRYVNLLDSKTKRRPRVPVVLDPVIRSSSGHQLIDAEGLASLRGRLVPLVDWITPNLEELALLAGKVVDKQDDVPAACRALKEAAQNKEGRGKLGVLAKGGHLGKPDDYLLTPEGEGFWLPGVRVETEATHGTGCALSSAFLSQLVLGEEPIEAARRAKAYVSGALRDARGIGAGHGPINHLWELSKVVD
jgi:hydroxymethylpyrimidine/phosphomethylpyrimidine kinase